MLSKNLLEKLNDQVNYEFYSSYTYLAMSAYCESIDLNGFANFFRIQAQEEVSHAIKLYDYILQKGGDVTLEAISRPESNYKDAVDVFEKGLAHERIVTKRIYDLVDVATEEKEHSTLSLLRWFVDEQVEEEDNFNTLLKKVKRSIDNPASLYMIDDELAQRVYTPPSDSSQ